MLTLGYRRKPPTPVGGLLAEVARLLGRGIDAVYRAAFKLRITKTPEFLKANCRLQEGTAVGRAYRFPKGYTPVVFGSHIPMAMPVAVDNSVSEGRL